MSGDMYRIDGDSTGEHIFIAGSQQGNEECVDFGEAASNSVNFEIEVETDGEGKDEDNMNTFLLDELIDGSCNVIGGAEGWYEEGDTVEATIETVDGGAPLDRNTFSSGETNLERLYLSDGSSGSASLGSNEWTVSFEADESGQTEIYAHDWAYNFVNADPRYEQQQCGIVEYDIDTEPPVIHDFSADSGYSENPHLTSRNAAGTAENCGAIENCGVIEGFIDFTWDISDNNELDSSWIARNGDESDKLETSACHEDDIFQESTTGSCSYEVQEEFTAEDFNYTFFVEDVVDLYNSSNISFDIDNSPPFIDDEDDRVRVESDNDPSDVVGPDDEVTIIAESITKMGPAPFDPEGGYGRVWLQREDECVDDCNLISSEGDTYEHTFIPDGIGEIEYRLYAKDGISNYDYVSVTVTVDDNPPNVDIINPEADEVISSNYEVEIEASDEISGVDEVLYCIDAEQCTPDLPVSHESGDTYTVTIDTTTLGGDGDYYLTSCATDLAGNENCTDSEMTVEVDNTPPSITILDLEDDDIVNSDLELTATVTDENLDEDSVTLDVGETISDMDPDEVDGNDFTFQIDTTGLDEGQNEFVVSASDTASTPNEAEESVTLIVNNEPPVITIESPDSGDKIKGEFVATMEIFDEATSVEEAYCEIDGSGPYNAISVGSDLFECTIDTDIPDIDDGPDVPFVVNASDESGNWDTEDIGFYVDNTPPFGSQIDLDTLYLRTDESVLIIGSDVTDPPFGTDGLESCSIYYSNDDEADHLELLLDDDMNPDCTGQFTLSEDEDGDPVISEGNEKYIVAYFEDKLGHSNFTSQEVVVDNTPPSVYNLLFNGEVDDHEEDDDIKAYLQGDEEINISVEADDEDDGLVTGISSVAISSNYTSSELTMGYEEGYRYDITTSPAEMGCDPNANCTLNITAYDDAGNTEAVYANITVDSTVPVITDKSVDSDYMRNETEVEVEVLLSDSIFSIRKVTAEDEELDCSSVPGGTLCSGNVLATDYSEVGFNRHINISAENFADLVANASIPVVFDDIDPELSDLDYSDENNISNSRDSYTFTVDVTDENNFGEEGDIDAVILYGADPSYNVTMSNPQDNLYRVTSNMSQIGYDTDTNGGATFTARAYDRAGNWDETSYEFTLNNIPPELSGAFYYEGDQADPQETLARWDINPPDWLEPNPPNFPFFRVVMVHNLTWKANSTDADVGIDQVYLTTGCNDQEFPMTNSTYKTFGVNGTPEDLGCEIEGDDLIQNNTVSVTSVDNANNSATKVFNLTLIEDIPLIQGISASPSALEMNYDTTTITAGMDILSGLKEDTDEAITVTVISEDDEEEFTFSLEDDEITDEEPYYEVNMEYGPPTSPRYHNVTVSAINTYDAEGTMTETDVFFAIPETSGELDVDPPVLEVDEVSYDDPYIENVTYTLENTGFATMRDTNIYLGPLSGVTNNLSENLLSCGEVDPGSQCEETVEYNVTTAAGDGLRTMSIVAIWENPDMTDGSTIFHKSFDIDESYGLKEIGSTLQKMNLTESKEELLGMSTLRNYGNIVLESISDEFEGVDTSMLDMSDDLDGDLEIAETYQSSYYANITERGNYTLNITTSDADCIPEGSCEVFRSIDLNVIDYIDLSKESPFSDNLERDREDASFLKECRLLSEHTGNPLESHPVNMTVLPVSTFPQEDPIVEEMVSDADGIVQYEVDLTGMAAGDYNVSCVAVDDLEDNIVLIDHAQETNISSIGDIDLNVERVENDGPIYFYDDEEPYNTTFQVDATDELNTDLEGVDIELYSNATSDFEIQNVGNCTTGESGSCNFTFNPSVNTDGDFMVYVNATREHFNPSDTYEEPLTLIGDFEIQITQPSPENIRYYLEEEGTLAMNVSEELDVAEDVESVTWFIDGDPIDGATQVSTTNPFNPSVEDYSRGEYEFSVEVIVKDGGDNLTDQALGQIWDDIYVDDYNVSTLETPRMDSEIDLDALLLRSSTDEPIEDYACDWYEGDRILGTTSTDQDGVCGFTVETNGSFDVGPNDIKIILEDDETEFYSSESEESEEVFLTEGINVEITSPAYDVFYRDSSVSLDAIVEDEVDELINIDFGWFLVGDETYELAFNPTSTGDMLHEYELGEYDLTANASKEYYDDGEETLPVELRSHSTLGSSINSEVIMRGDTIELVCDVIDQYTGSPIEGYDVNLTIVNSQEEISSETLATDSEGEVALSVSDTTELDVDGYTGTCEISDQEDIFYEAEGGPIDNPISVEEFIVSDDISFSYTKEEDTLLRHDDETIADEELPRESLFEFDVSDSLGSLEDANVSMNIDQEEVGDCMTDQDGACDILLNPDSRFSPGLNEILLSVSKDLYQESEQSADVDIKVPVNVNWTRPQDLKVIDFREDELVNSSCTIYETDTLNPVSGIEYSTHPYISYPGEESNITFSASDIIENDGMGRTIATEQDPTVTGDAQLENSSIDIDPDSTAEITYDLSDINTLNIDSLRIDAEGEFDYHALGVSGDDEEPVLTYILEREQLDEITLQINSSSSEVILNSFTLFNSEPIREYALSDFMFFRQGDTYSGSMDNIDDTIQFEGIQDTDGWHSLYRTAERSNNTMTTSGGEASLGLDEEERAIEPSDNVTFRYRRLGSSSFGIDADMIGFFAYDESGELNISIRIKDNQGYVSSETFGSIDSDIIPSTRLDGFREFQHNISGIDKNDIEYMEFVFENDGDDVIEPEVNLVNVYLYDDIYSDLTGKVEFAWRAARAGMMRTGCMIHDQGDYLANMSYSEALYEIISAEEIEADDDEDLLADTIFDDIGATSGSVFSFSVLGDPIWRYALDGSSGLLSELTVVNHDDSGLELDMEVGTTRINNLGIGNEVNLFSLDGSNISSLEVARDSQSSFGVDFNLSSAVEKGLVDSVDYAEGYVKITTDDGSSEYIVPIQVNSSGLDVYDIVPNSSEPVFDVRQDDLISVGFSSELENAALLDSLNYDVFIVSGADRLSCPTVNESIDSSGAHSDVSIDCQAPRIPLNPLNTSLEIEASLSDDVFGLEPAGSLSFIEPSGVIYSDVLPPIIRDISHNVNGSGVSLSADLSDNDEVSSAEAVVGHSDGVESVTVSLDPGQTNLSDVIGESYVLDARLRFDYSIGDLNFSAIGTGNASRELEFFAGGSRVFSDVSLGTITGIEQSSDGLLRNSTSPGTDYLTHMHLPLGSTLTGGEFFVDGIEASGSLSDPGSLGYRDGYYYVLDSPKSTINIFDDDLTHVDRIVLDGTTVRNPNVFSIADDESFISDGGRIHVYDEAFETRHSRIDLSADTIITHIERFDDKLAITQPAEDRIVVMRLSEDYAHETIADIEAGSPQSLSYDTSRSELFAYLQSNNSISVYDSDFGFNRSYALDDDVEISGMSNIDVDDGLVIVSDTFGGRIIGFEADGDDLSLLGELDSSLVSDIARPYESMLFSSSELDTAEHGIIFTDMQTGTLSTFSTDDFTDAVELDSASDTSAFLPERVKVDIGADHGPRRTIVSGTEFNNLEYFFIDPLEGALIDDSSGFLNDAAGCAFPSSLQDHELFPSDDLRADRYDSFWCRVPVYLESLPPGKISVSDISFGYDLSHESLNLAALLNSHPYLGYNASSEVLDSLSGVELELELVPVDGSSSFDISSGNSSHISLNETGRYISIVSSEDASGNPSQRSSTFFFEEPSSFSSTLSTDDRIRNIEVSLTPVVSESIDDLDASTSFSAGSNEIASASIMPGTYDFSSSVTSEISDLGDTTSHATLDFKGASFNYIFNNATQKYDIARPVDYNSFNHTELSLPEDVLVLDDPSIDRLAYSGISVTTNFSSFDSVEVGFNYSEVRSSLAEDGHTIDPDDLEIMRCAGDDAHSCSSSDWEILDLVDHDDDLGIITAESDTASSFIVVEYIFEDEDEAPDEDEDTATDDRPDTAPDAPPAPATEDEAVTADDEDIVIEDDDLRPSYNIELGILEYMSLRPGENRTVPIFIFNRQSSDLDLNLTVTGDGLPDLMHLSHDDVVVPPFSNRRVDVDVIVPEEEEPRLVSGSMIFDPSGFEPQSLPLILRIAEDEDFIFDLSLDLASDSFGQTDLLFILSELENEWVRDSEIGLTYTLNPLDYNESDRDILGDLISIERSMMFDQYYSENVSIDPVSILTNMSHELPDEAYDVFLSYTDEGNALLDGTSGIMLDEGQYLLELEVYFNNVTSSTSSIVSISNPFYQSAWFRVLLGFILFSSLTGLVVYSVVSYKKYARSKRRYVIPDVHNLPGREKDTVNFKVGRIAGTKYDAYIDSRDLTKHALVAGSTGSGKSVSASVVVEEALNNKIPVVVFDPTSQWTGFLSALKDDNIYKTYRKFNMSKDEARSYKGLIFTPRDSDFELDFDEYLNPGEVTVFNLAHLSTKDYDEATAKIVQALFDKGWEESPDLRLICVFDEVHRLLDPSTAGKGYAALTRGAREFRKWGIGLVMASQVSSDFKEAIGGNVLTEVQLNTKNLADIEKAKQKYGEEYAKRITRQGLGVAMVQNPGYNKGMPWFINFRPPLHNPHKLSDDDLATYDKFTTELKKIKSVMRELKKLGVDTGDIEMDYNLANSKLKEGKFKMVDMYVEELENTLKKSPKYSQAKKKSGVDL